MCIIIVDVEFRYQEKEKEVNKNIMRFISVFGILLILSGIWVSQVKDRVSAAEMSLEVGESGLSFKYEGRIGTTGEPYIIDTLHLNRPTGLFIDDTNNVFVVEESGYRMLKYGPSGNNLLAIGRAGINYTDDYVFNNPKDITVDGDANIWVADTNRLAIYDTSGLFLQNYPADNPWESGSSNGQFDGINGIAIHENILFVSDSNNHRIQIFDISSGNPFYTSTLGETGVSGDDNTHFNYPGRIAVDTNGILYVVDVDNNRVQQCTNSGSWVCVTYVSNLNYPQGIDVKGSDVYVTSTYDWEILKCSGIENCTKFNQDLAEIHDVALDSSGYVYGSFANGSIIIKYDTDGSTIETFIGQPNIPYVTDTNHFHAPRVYIDSSDNLIIVEEAGQRLLKFDPQGNFLWSVGTAGTTSDDNEHFNYPHAVATDSQDNIYVADSWRVQIFNKEGVYQNTIKDLGDMPFDWITGIAVDSDGNIYVSDAPKHVIKIFDSNLNFIEQIGELNECGSDNDHFCWPIGIDTDKYGNLYVADAGNARFQKFNNDLEWVMTLGTTGSWGDSFSEFDTPEDVAIDALGRIYTAEMWTNKRIQVFSMSGKYLTTIGGDWGENNSDFYAISSVGVNSEGKVYISDFQLGRIQIFSPGVPDWKQSNINGFGDKTNAQIPALASFKGYLYAGTWKYDGDLYGDLISSAEIWRTADGSTWEKVDTRQVNGCAHMIEFDGYLYCGSWDGRIWRTANGTIWAEEISEGFGYDHAGIARFAVFEDMLYASTWTESDTEIWRTDDGTNWTRFEDFGLEDNNASAISSVIYNGNLYWGTTNWYSDAQLWKTDGDKFTIVFNDGLGLSGNFSVSALASFDSYLYAGIVSNDDIQVFRSNDELNWESVLLMSDVGSGAHARAGLEVHQNELFLVAQNLQTGVEVWKTADGTQWKQVGFEGFGDSNNETAYWDNGVTTFNGKLFIAISNFINGGEIWRYEPFKYLYLPLIIK